MRKGTITSIEHHVNYFDTVRSAALLAVIVQHISAYYLFKWGEVPRLYWEVANLFVSMTRWGVPVFIMISGALLIRPDSKFNASNYLKRRCLKVVLPFFCWSIIYAIWLANARNLYPFHIEINAARKLILSIPTKSVYSHLGFFYYFIPLYFVIPFISAFISNVPDRRQIVLFASYIILLLTFLYLLGVRSWWLDNMVIYSGYMVIWLLATQFVIIMLFHLNI